MTFKFFNKEIDKSYSYLLLLVYKNNIDHCATYYKGVDGEYITSISTGERFYNLYDFVFSINGLATINEFMECYFYSEVCENWVPIAYL